MGVVSAKKTIDEMVRYWRDERRNFFEFRALEQASEALQKQIPMKIVDRQHCPACGGYLGCESFEQCCCDNCGQRLNW